MPASILDMYLSWMSLEPPNLSLEPRDGNNRSASSSGKNRPRRASTWPRHLFHAEGHCLFADRGCIIALARNRKSQWGWKRRRVTGHELGCHPDDEIRQKLSIKGIYVMRRSGLLLRLASIVLCQGLLAQTPVQYDILLKGGHVIDPKNGINGPRDVAIAAGKIARVDANIPPAEARRVVDVNGLYVTPGLLDIHVHVYAGTGMRRAYSGDNSVYPDGHTFRSGVTTVVDVGSSGWRNFVDFKDRVIDRSRTRVLAMLNIVGRGMGGGEIEQDTDDMNAEATAKVAKLFPEVIVGIKTAHYAGPEWVAVDRAVEAGGLASIPIMVDFGRFQPERPYEELVLKHLRPGDISTHMYQSRVPMFDEKGKIRPFLFEARKRGVKFDVGHGGGSFLWKQAIPAIQQGWSPDSISTDLHITSMNRGMKTMLNLMSKLLSQGISLQDVVKMTTSNPASQIHRTDLGHLSVGAGADVAVLRMDEGTFGFLDARNARAMGTKLLRGEMTLRDGRVVWDLNGRASEDWKTFDYSRRREFSRRGRRGQQRPGRRF